MLIKLGWIRGVKTLVEEGGLGKRIQKAQEGDKRVVKAYHKWSLTYL